MLYDSTKNIYDTYRKGIISIPDHKEYLKVYDYFIQAFRSILIEWNKNIVTLQRLSSGNYQGQVIQLELSFTQSENSFDQFISNSNTAYLFRDIRVNKTRTRGCFIVTAVYGTPLAPEIDIFRRYRDEQLKNND